MIEDYAKCSVCGKYIHTCTKEHTIIHHNGKDHYVHDDGQRWNIDNCSYKLREMIRRNEHGSPLQL